MSEHRYYVQGQGDRRNLKLSWGEPSLRAFQSFLRDPPNMDDDAAVARADKIFQKEFETARIEEIISMTLYEGERVVKNYPATKKTPLHLRTGDFC